MEKNDKDTTQETVTAPQAKASQEKEPYAQPRLTKHESLRNPLGFNGSPGPE